MEKGSIMRTGMRPSVGFLPRGTRAGLKSAGMYLFRTLRSPMIVVYCCVKVGECTVLEKAGDVR